MKFALTGLELIFAGASLLAVASPVLAKPKTLQEDFDIKKEPAKADWRYFMKSPEKSRSELWAYHSTQGKTLGNWAWGWRLGWVRTCAESKETYCGQVMRQALTDKALVVRAEAATRIGRRYDGSGDAKIVELLAGAYKHHGNSRNGKPLFVQNRILYALHQVGGKEALAQGKTLAGLHPETKSYWTRLQAVDDGSTAAK